VCSALDSRMLPPPLAPEPLSRLPFRLPSSSGATLFPEGEGRENTLPNPGSNSVTERRRLPALSTKLMDDCLIAKGSSCCNSEEPHGGVISSWGLLPARLLKELQFSFPDRVVWLCAVVAAPAAAVALSLDPAKGVMGVLLQLGSPAESPPIEPP
jgi:hypothetical protein